MPEGADFDIYQTAAGYTAVTNPVRRQILDALSQQDRELPDLVKLTGKSKPTLSNLHVRELLEKGLVEEMPHPTDARRKVYRIAARRIGRSNVPLEQLRGAVKHYVSLSPLAYAVPFPAVLEVLAAGWGAGAAARDAVRKQAQRLGESASQLFTTTSPRDVMTAVAGFWEREGVARTARMDFDRMEFEVELTGSEQGAEAMGSILAGVLEGVLRSRLGVEGAVGAKAKGRKVVLSFPKG